MRESIEEDIEKCFLQNRTSRKCEHQVCEYPDCIYQTLKPDVCNISGCSKKLHHMCQNEHDAKYWNCKLEDKVHNMKVCYICAKEKYDRVDNID